MRMEEMFKEANGGISPRGGLWLRKDKENRKATASEKESPDKKRVSTKN
jgi:hypothetical protein